MGSKFLGPLFIVGMPRSGTKLVRALLNQHPKINLTLAESHFIPYLVNKFGNPPPFRVREDLEPFVRELRKTSFYATMKEVGYSIDEPTFLQNIDLTTWSSVFEHVFRFFGPKRMTTDTVWGDKTPGYINHLPFLAELFPGAKFIHIVRDPRDYCLSVRKSFGKSIYRAAARWRQSVEIARRYGTELGKDYMEVRYELLLEKPALVMTQVASFLGVPYDDAMVNLTSAPEKVGDARGHAKIVADNKNKYRNQLSSPELKRIEELVCDVAVPVGYRLENNVAYRPLSRLSLGMLKLYDGLASLKYHAVVEGGFTTGARSLFHHYKRSSWRGVEIS